MEGPAHRKPGHSHRSRLFQSRDCLFQGCRNPGNDDLLGQVQVRQLHAVMSRSPEQRVADRILVEPDDCRHGSRRRL